MIHAKIKDEEERKHLNDALAASRKKNWYRRLMVVELSAKGHTVQQLSGLFGVCEATIRN